MLNEEYLYDIHSCSNSMFFFFYSRHPKSIVKPSKGTPEDDNRFNTEMEKNKSTAIRHLFLIRHGQYNLNGRTDKERVLTELGFFFIIFTSFN